VSDWIKLMQHIFNDGKTVRETGIMKHGDFDWTELDGKTLHIFVVRPDDRITVVYGRSDDNDKIYLLYMSVKE
jgi:hypothetical protein